MNYSNGNGIRAERWNCEWLPPGYECCQREAQRAADNPGVEAWFETVEDDELFLSVLVLGEIRKGIERARSTDPSKALALERWLAGLEQKYGERVLPVTGAVAEQWGRLTAIRPLPTVDSLLGATALEYDLTLVTRDISALAHTGVKLLNPFTA